MFDGKSIYLYLFINKNKLFIKICTLKSLNFFGIFLVLKL